MNKFTRPSAAGQRSVDEITGSRRLRRMRKADWSRRLVQENRLTADDLIWPIFVVDGDNRREEIAAMPGVFRMTIDLAVKAAVPEIGIITDAALDPFTSHGHDGILREGIIVNDETVAQVTAAAVLQAE